MSIRHAALSVPVFAFALACGGAQAPDDDEGIPGICEEVADDTPATTIESERTLLVGGTVFTATGEVHDPGYVLFEDGRIVEVGLGEPDAPGDTFGSYGWTRIPNLTKVYRDILVRHFTHHVAIGMCHVGNSLYEAFGNYLGMKCFADGKCASGGYSPSLPFEFAGTQEVELPE